jgi:uncharacterized protein (TIGR00297 family)
MPLSRIAAGFLLALAIALLARRARALSPSGAAAAVLVGIACVAAGWSWGALLVAFFVASTALSRVGAASKERRTRGIVAKGGERDAMQVIANGGPFALAALGALAWPHPLWNAIGAASLAASTADTWATEIGTLAGGTPRSVLSWKPVPPGTSGGITLPGTLGSVAGALFIGTLALAMEWPIAAFTAAVLGGVVGSTADTLIGAKAQARRWCDRCDGGTERMVHDCGTATRHAGGIAWLDNDVVNLLASLTGAAAGAAVALAMGARP